MVPAFANNVAQIRIKRAIIAIANKVETIEIKLKLLLVAGETPTGIPVSFAENIFVQHVRVSIWRKIDTCRLINYYTVVGEVRKDFSNKNARSY